MQGKIAQEEKSEIKEGLFYDISRKGKRTGMFY